MSRHRINLMSMIKLDRPNERLLKNGDARQKDEDDEKMIFEEIVKRKTFEERVGGKWEREAKT